MRNIPKGGLIGRAYALMRYVSAMRIPVYAANASFFIVLAVFPMLLLFVSILRYTGLSANTLTDLLDGVIPDALLPAAQRLILSTYQSTSGTVVSKGKGSGFLGHLEELERFLDEIYEKSPITVSVKTRLGVTDPDEFGPILELYNRYPIPELTIHPRVRKQFYDGSVYSDMFRYAIAHTKNPLCYNGDLWNTNCIDTCAAQFPVDAVMLGRGLIGNPGMLTPDGTDVRTLEAFHNELLDTYTEAFGGGRNAMFRLKENWHMLIAHFENSEKLWKRLRKTTYLQEFRSITAEIFHTLQWK